MSEKSVTHTPVSKKRSHDEAEGLVPFHTRTQSPEETQLPTPTSPAASQLSPRPGRQLSPAISVESSALSDAKTMTLSAAQATPPPVTSSGAAKKQKLTFAEKELERVKKQSEKEEKEKKKADELQRKEQEKLLRDQEKRRKEEEKEVMRKKREVEKAEKQKARDEEKQAKEEAKRKKEEEKKKKERSQLRLGCFFQKPVAGEVTEESSHASSRRSSVISLGGLDDHDNEVPAKGSPQKRVDAKHGFLPFFVPQNVKLAPANRFARDGNLSHMAISRLDTWMVQGNSIHAEDLTSKFKSRKRKRCQMPPCTMKEIVESIQGTSTSPIDLTGEPAFPQLSRVAYKILSFREDVRPPYEGTYTRAVSPTSAVKLSRRPFSRQLPNTNYDYDSEAEWEPPNEDDEDLGSGDDESDIGEDGEEDMDGFLDDEDDLGRRRQVMGEMIPVNSGLCWTNTTNEGGPLEEYRIQMLSDHHLFPIDPYSTAYWPRAHQVSRQPAMQPPRLPLSSLNPNSSPAITSPWKAEEEEKSDERCQNSTGLTQATETKAGKPLKLAPDEVLPDFKQAVRGSDLTKVGLIEILKKQFPKLSKDTIKDTLGHVASREGAHTDKKWVLKD
ncbi:hypothetical protein EPUS_06369 [Endocarpon pusillum Z07020]|uniref:Chromatin assembly factor 1 subunit A n=1 Tax=Endocarpon pusillum (strain Z07020 / HMAS-L-300199) TaxID=1263415 RepID=U1HU01_ENDPU|nr:uncharacterized protein EPUS_06369 [Endocarpon pusillum Z07020]ERF74100.1 hypothetical protein EPUS_06369 [Endocarpon pusillum Z07020]